jgi:hypothetical protein
MVDHKSGNSGLLHLRIQRFQPTSFHAFDAKRDSAGRVILYTVVKSGEIQEVGRSGKLSALPEGFLRYYFTKCEYAQAFRGTMLSSGRDAAGIIRIPATGDIASKLVGVTARQTGKSNLMAWGLEEATGATWDQAQVVASGGGAGCGL